MSPSGPVQCPSCQCPIAEDSVVCPYCHASVPQGSRWKDRLIGLLIVLLCGLLVVWGSDRYFGTKLVQSLRDVVHSSDH